MKKTIQTLLTAAVFSAAVTSSLSVSAQEAALASTAQPMATVYGPPWVFALPGDINYDDSIDARDLTLLKRAILEENFRRSDLYLGDLNGDDEIDKADVKELIRLLTGKPEDEEDPEVTTDITTTTERPWTTVVLYGPPRAWN